MLFGIFQKQFINQRFAAACIAVVFFLPVVSPAQRLPIKTYTVGDSLAHNNVNRIFQDAKGFLWIATAEGLSRFDGYGFTNYGTTDGLNHIFVNDIAVDREGNLWIATNGGGVSRLIDQPDEGETSAARKKFVSFMIADGGESNKANFVNRILFDEENRLWCLTDDGLYSAKQREVAERDFEQVVAAPAGLIANAALADRRGRLWFSLNAQAIQFAGEKRFDYEIFREVNKTVSQTPEFLNLVAFAEDESGRIFASDRESVYEFVEPETDGTGGSWRKLAVKIQTSKLIRTIAPAANGGLWIGTSDGLIRYRDGQQTPYTTANGLSVNAVNAVLTDREGYIWIGTSGGGVNKLASDTVIGYTVAEGLPSSDVYRFTADRDGIIYAQVGCVKQNIVQISAEKVNIIPHSELKNGRCNQTHLLQDAQGRWWFQSKNGLWISDTSQLEIRNGRLFTAAEIGLPELSAATEMYEDADGKIWLVNSTSGNLYMTDTKLAGTPHFQIAANDVPAEFILRDLGGTLWLASRDKLWRIKNGQVTEIKNIENLPRIEPRCLFQDSRGRVWIGTRYNGAIVTDEPEAENPRFAHYTTAEGLASQTVWTISEDDDGRIYLGTGRGVDQLDTTTNKLRHFTNDDGIVGSVINHLFKDFQGNIWVASDLGISRINGQVWRVETKPPPIFINRVLVAGEELPLAETGVSAFVAPDLSANQNNITIHFVGLSFQKEHALRYQYKLEGADGNWSAAGEQREVTFANLGAGNYRFLVRAENSEGAQSENPAAFEFQILRPVWQRWWFLLLAILLFSGLIILIYRRRVSRLLEMERVRTRIATDLHDDIGANLTKIAILSEVANQQSGHNSNGGGANNLLGSVAEISRESVSAMGDIVWAINPKKDSLIGLTRRMRQYAEEILEQRDITLAFDAPTVEQDLKLNANIRRNVYLIFKESVNNIIRHSNAAAVKIDFRVTDKELVFQIGDDGNGFDPTLEFDGNGLLNIKKRADDCGGRLEIDSATGAGTKIVLRLKLKSAGWSWR